MRNKALWNKKWLRVGVVSQLKGLSFLNQSHLPCDLVEIRLDYFTLTANFLDQIKKTLAKRKQPVLLTLRASTEGGQQKLPYTQRQEILLPLLPYIDAIDIELAYSKRLFPLLKEIQKIKLPLILSAHSFQKSFTQNQIKSLLLRMKKQKATIYKIASYCGTPSDLLLLLQNQIKFSSLALMGMGEMTILSRQLLPLLGSKLVYGYLDSPTAPGQPHVKTLPKAPETHFGAKPQKER